MGLLDDLRKQSTDKKQQQAIETARLEKLNAFYRSDIHPKMTAIYTHLNEMVEHLNFIKPDIKVPYKLNASGTVRKLVQSGYKINTDSSEEMKQLILTFTCALDSAILFEVENKKIVETHIEYLQRFKLQYTSKLYRDDNHDVVSAKFKVKCRVPVTIVFEGDVENSCIIFKLKNFAGLGLQQHVIKPKNVDDEFLDELSTYLVRESDEFMKLDLSEADRRKLQHKIRLEKLQREKEMREAEKRIREEEALAKVQKPAILGLFSKDKGNNKK